MPSRKMTGMVLGVLLLLSSSTSFASKVKCEVTSYTPYECHSTMTSSGVKVREGMVATDWRNFPPGSLLYSVESDEFWVVGDTGGAIKGRKIDRFRYSYPQAIRDGRKTHTVYVLYKSKPLIQKESIKARVLRGFYLRNYVISHKKATSRGGYDRYENMRRHVRQLVIQIKYKKQVKKQPGIAEQFLNAVTKVGTRTPSGSYIKENPYITVEEEKNLRFGIIKPTQSFISSSKEVYRIEDKLDLRMKPRN